MFARGERNPCAREKIMRLKRNQQIITLEKKQTFLIHIVSIVLYEFDDALTFPMIFSLRILINELWWWSKECEWMNKYNGTKNKSLFGIIVNFFSLSWVEIFCECYLSSSTVDEEMLDDKPTILDLSWEYIVTWAIDTSSVIEVSCILRVRSIGVMKSMCGYRPFDDGVDIDFWSHHRKRIYVDCPHIIGTEVSLKCGFCFHIRSNLISWNTLEMMDWQS